MTALIYYVGRVRLLTDVTGADIEAASVGAVRVEVWP